MNKEKTVLLAVGFPRHFQRNEVFLAEEYLCKEREAHPEDAEREAAWRITATLAALYRFQTGIWVYIGEAEPRWMVEDGWKVPVYDATAKFGTPHEYFLDSWCATHEILQHVTGKTPEQARHAAFEICRKTGLQPIHPFKNCGLAEIEIE